MCDVCDTWNHSGKPSYPIESGYRQYYECNRCGLLITAAQHRDHFETVHGETMTPTYPQENRYTTPTYAQEQLESIKAAANEVKRHPNSQKFHDRLDLLKALHDRKQKDYGTSDDPFANVRGVENLGIPAWVGVVMRIEDKMRRLQNAARQALEGGQVSLANESVEDSFDDLAVYAQIGAILFEEWSNSE